MKFFIRFFKNIFNSACPSIPPKVTDSPWDLVSPNDRPSLAQTNRYRYKLNWRYHSTHSLAQRAFFFNVWPARSGHRRSAGLPGGSAVAVNKRYDTQNCCVAGRKHWGVRGRGKNEWSSLKLTRMALFLGTALCVSLSVFRGMRKNKLIFLSVWFLEAPWKYSECLARWKKRKLNDYIRDACSPSCSRARSL